MQLSYYFVHLEIDHGQDLVPEVQSTTQTVKEGTLEKKISYQKMRK